MVSLTSLVIIAVFAIVGIYGRITREVAEKELALEGPSGRRVTRQGSRGGFISGGYGGYGGYGGWHGGYPGGWSGGYYPGDSWGSGWSWGYPWRNEGGNPEISGGPPIGEAPTGGAFTGGGIHSGSYICYGSHGRNDLGWCCRHVTQRRCELYCSGFPIGHRRCKFNRKCQQTCD